MQQVLRRRVVITGIGIISPIGCGTGKKIFQRLIAGECGVQTIPKPLLDAISNQVSVAALVPTTSDGKDEDSTHYDDSHYKSIQRDTSLFIRYALRAAEYALQDSGLKSVSDHYDPTLCGAAIGNGGIGSLSEILATSNQFQQSYKKVSPYFVPKILVNMAAGHVSIAHKLRGPVHSVATACAAGSHSIGDAADFIRFGRADFMLAGGADASIEALGLIGFARMRALSTDQSTTASRPFDARRSGFVMGEGAAVLVLEEREQAIARGAMIIAEIAGYGLSGDAFHATSPATDGTGAVRSMQMALRDAQISARDIDYFNAHSTSTPLGDNIEYQAVLKLVQSDSKGDRIPYISSTKGATGHLLGAAGAIETAFTALSLQYNIVPHTLHLQDLEPAMNQSDALQHVPQQSIDYTSGETIAHTKDHSAIQAICEKNCTSNNTSKVMKFALKNSFGFGGTNASLVLARHDNK